MDFQCLEKVHKNVSIKTGHIMSDQFFVAFAQKTNLKNK